ncbi:hypothetical protein VB712_13610, partial [Spirulina sp. CCNP1310]|uniref:hypothetical protein n=1 Tax=Spirulina sp. CCNP1310 TaxID=3110249 RepID=UPI002B221579
WGKREVIRLGRLGLWLGWSNPAQLSPVDEPRIPVALARGVSIESLQEPDAIPEKKPDLDPMLTWEGNVLVYQGEISPTFDLVAAVQVAREESLLR